MNNALIKASNMVAQAIAFYGFTVVSLPCTVCSFGYGATSNSLTEKKNQALQNSQVNYWRNPIRPKHPTAYYS